MRKFRSVVPDVSSIFSLEYESCELGKYHRATYPSQVTSSRSPFELAHSDVWGPSCNPSIKGFRYFLLFVDDFSHTVFVISAESYPTRHGLR